MELSNASGTQISQHPRVLPFVALSIAALFGWQLAGLHLNVEVGGSRTVIWPGDDGIFHLPGEINYDARTYVIGIRASLTESTTGSSTTSTPSHTSSYTPPAPPVAEALTPTTGPPPPATTLHIAGGSLDWVLPISVHCILFVR